MEELKSNIDTFADYCTAYQQEECAQHIFSRTTKHFRQVKELFILVDGRTDDNLVGYFNKIKRHRPSFRDDLATQCHIEIQRGKRGSELGICRAT